MSKTNRYRSSKNPEQEVLVTKIEEGQYAVSVFDTKNLRIVHKVIGEAEPEAEQLSLDIE